MKSCCCHSHPHSHSTHGLRAHAGSLLSFLLLLGGIGMDLCHTPFFHAEGIRLFWYLIAYIPVALPIWQSAWQELRRGSVFNEFSLMALASLGALCIGEYPEGVAVLLFYTVGEYFQERAAGKARNHIEALIRLTPENATVLRGGKTVVLPVKDITPGEIIALKTGERAPVDGTLTDRPATFNTAALTGESLPRLIQPGEEVSAGMIPTTQAVCIRALRPADQSAMARILHLVQEASERKAPAELFIRRFARIYTPIVTALAAAIFLIPYIYSLANPQFSFVPTEWIYRALVFLVLSCPCALVVSIPLGYFGGIGAASRKGILFKGGNYLDAISRVNTIVFDKTGTLTRGVFEVQSVFPAPGVDPEKLLSLVASAEQFSSHPIGRAVLRYAENHRISLSRAEQTQEAAGYGLQCRVEGKALLVGNMQWLHRAGIEIPPSDETETGTTVACAFDGHYMGRLLLADQPKEDTATAIENLRKLGIRHIQVLSGDKQSIVTAFAQKAGIHEAYGDLLPEGKVRHIEALKQDPARRIAFVGDGLNDAPVLALSHVGIAMGGIGSDAAIDTADVVIRNDRPSQVATAIRIGRRTRRIVHQNIVLALSAKTAVLLLGAMGIATLWEAVFADVGIALITIANATRLLHLDKGTDETS